MTYDCDLAKLAAKHPDTIEFIATVSGADDVRSREWKGGNGRVNAVARKYLEKFDLPKESTTIYLRGHPGMIQDVNGRVAPNGWKIIKERFWKQ